jgi:hypothetical protein
MYTTGHRRTAQLPVMALDFGVLGPLQTAVGTQTATAHLRDRSGRAHPLLAAATRIGRLPDNEIVFDDPTSAATMRSSSTPEPVA